MPASSRPLDLPTVPVTRTQRVMAAAVAGLVTVIGIAAIPYANTKLIVVPGFITAFCAAMVVINIILATLLFSKGAIQKSGDATRLGAAYLLEALMLVSLLMSFPDAIMPGSLIGTGVSAIWVWLFWHAGFGLCIVHYAWRAGQQDRHGSSLAWSLAGVALFVAAATITSTTFLPYLPSTFDDGHTLFSGASGRLPGIIMVIDLCAFLLVCRLRFQTAEQLWLGVAMVASMFDVWLTYLGTQRYSLGWYLSKSGTVVTSLTVLLSLLHEITLLHLRAASANAVLTDLAHRDGLTGLCNRRSLDALIDAAWRLGAREGRPLSILMIDVDYFKKFNDRYGHPDGDDCLRQVAEVLRAAARRPADVAARYGGEEFVVLMPHTGPAGAAEVARSIQAGMRALAIEHAGSPLGCVTLSIGQATAQPTSSSSPETLLAEADRGLYQAKSDGRNRICRATERSEATLPQLAEAKLDHA